MSLRDDTCAYQLGGNWTKVAEDGNQFGVLNNSFGDWEKKQTGYLSIKIFQTSLITQPKLQKMYLFWSWSESLFFFFNFWKIDSIWRMSEEYMVVGKVGGEKEKGL